MINFCKDNYTLTELNRTEQIKMILNNRLKLYHICESKSINVYDCYIKTYKKDNNSFNIFSSYNNDEQEISAPLIK